MPPTTICSRSPERGATRDGRGAARSRNRVAPSPRAGAAIAWCTRCSPPRSWSATSTPWRSSRLIPRWPSLSSGSGIDRWSRECRLGGVGGAVRVPVAREPDVDVSGRERVESRSSIVLSNLGRTCPNARLGSRLWHLRSARGRFCAGRVARSAVSRPSTAGRARPGLDTSRSLGTTRPTAASFSGAVRGYSEITTEIAIKTGATAHWPRPWAALEM